MAQRWWFETMRFAAGLWVGLAAVSTQAQSTCEIDADCDFGFSCQVVGSSYACPAIACVDGTACPQPDCPPPQDIKACEPLRDCQGDAQCAPGFVCHSETYENCTMPAGKCDASGVCTTDMTATCEPVTETYCAPRWTLSCTAAADCGSGFDCVEQQMCWCSGSAGTAGGATGTAEVDGGASMGGSDLMAPLPEGDAGVVDPACGCSGSGTFVCELQDLPCASDADCESGLTCQEDLYSATCATIDVSGAPVIGVGGTVDTAGAQDAGIAVSSGGSTGVISMDAATMECPPPAKRCAPPDYFAGFGGISRAAAADGTLTLGAANDVDSGVVSGDVLAQSPTHSNTDEASGATPGHVQLGCSVMGSSVGFGQLAFVALALVGLRRRRR